jgi:uncharacterized protein (TIGR02246 family)
MPARTPEEVDSMFEQGVNAGDVDAVVALYEPTATLISQPGQAATGSAEILAAVKEMIALKPQVKLTVNQTITAGDVAVLYNDWSGTFTGPDGNEMPVTGKAIEVVRRQADGTWLFVVDDPWARGF